MIIDRMFCRALEMERQASDAKYEHPPLIEPHRGPETSHNSPMSRLSPELLVPIVKLATGLDEYQESICVVPYSHVCQSWRSIIISAPLLWRYIDVSLPRFAVECLLRSKGVPIWVTNNSWLNHAPPGWADLWALHTHRVTEISMDFRSSIALQMLLSIPSTLPSLTELTLRNYTREEIRFVLPFRSLPALRKLGLYGFSLQNDVWDLISGLTHLTCIDWYYHHTSPSLRRMFGIIARSPMLSLISLKGDFGSFEDLNETPILYRSHLREVSIAQQEIHSIHRLLSKLQLPPSCRLTLDGPIFHSPSPMLPQTTMQNFQIFSRTRAEFTDREFKLSETTGANNKEHTKYTFKCAQVTSQLLSSIISEFDLSKLTFLRMRSDIRIPPQDWKAVLTPLSALTTLELVSTPSHPNDGIQILDALADSSASVACMQLRWLTIRVLGIGKVPWKRWGHMRKALLLCLQKRADLETPVWKLHLRNFEVRPVFLDMLEDLVDSLTANGLLTTWEGGSDDEDSDGEEDYVDPGSRTPEYR